MCSRRNRITIWTILQIHSAFLGSPAFQVSKPQLMHNDGVCICFHKPSQQDSQNFGWALLFLVPNMIQKFNWISFFNVLFIFYCCSVRVVPIFLPIALPHPIEPPLPRTNPTPLSLFMGLQYMVLDLTLPLLSPIISVFPLLWSLSVCSVFPCLWFIFAHLFLLLIRFHVQVRSYGICLQLPGLFHIA